MQTFYSVVSTTVFLLNLIVGLSGLVLDVKFLCANLSQTVYLLNRTELGFEPLKLVDYSSSSLFRVSEKNRQVYLTYVPASDSEHELEPGQNPALDRLLRLSHDITVNVTFLERFDSQPTLNDQLAVQISVDYIFKLSNASKFGILKEDMPINGIVCIARINPSDDDDGVDLKIVNSNYFHVRKFQTNLFMIQVYNSLHDLAASSGSRYYEATVEARRPRTGILAGRTTLKFKLVRASELLIKFKPIDGNEIILNMDEDDGLDGGAHLYGGRFLTKINSFLTRHLFEEEATTMDEYKSDNIRFSIVETNTPQPLFEIDAHNGYMNVLPNRTIDREHLAIVLKTQTPRVWLNVSVYDTRKLFKTNYLKVVVQIGDVNDEEPRYGQRDYRLELDLNRMFEHEASFFGNRQYFLVFGETAVDPDYGENGTVSYHLIEASLSRADFYVDERTGQVWFNVDRLFLNQTLTQAYYFFHARILCKDSGRDFRHSHVDLFIRVRTGLAENEFYHSEVDRRLDVVREDVFYYEIELFKLVELGQLPVDWLPIRLDDTKSQSQFQLQPNELNSQFRDFFNLTIRYDGLATIHLNRNYFGHRARLDTINYVESRFNYVTNTNELKAVRIYFRFVDVSNPSWFFAFKKSSHEFEVDENGPKRFVHSFETNCAHAVDGLTVVTNSFSNFQADRLFKFAVSDLNRAYVDFYLIDALDYETAHQYNFWLVGKCVKPTVSGNVSTDHLMATRVRIRIVDLNDNPPVFVSPVFYDQLWSIRLDSVDDRLFELRAVDYDLSEKFSRIRYSIVDCEVIRLVNCNQPTNLTVVLDDMTGQLRLVKSGTSAVDGDIVKCPVLMVEYRLKVIAFNYLVENGLSTMGEFRLRVEIPSTGGFFTWHANVEMNTQPSVQFAGISRETFSLLRMDKCWINGHLNRRQFYLHKENGTLYLNARQPTDADYKIECRLLDPPAWLMVNVVRSPKLPDRLEQPVIHLNVSRSQLTDESNSQIAKFDHWNLIDSKQYLLVYKLADQDRIITDGLFELNALTGELTTRPARPDLVEIVQTVSLLRVDVQIRLLKVDPIRPTLARTYNFSLFMRLIDPQELEIDPLDAQIRNLHSRLFHKLITETDLNDDYFTVLELNQTSKIVYSIEQVHELDLSTGWEDHEMSGDVFRIDGGRLRFRLGAYKPSVNFYLVRMNLCYRQATVQNEDLFTRTCQIASFNVKLKSQLSLSELKFFKPRYSFDYYYISPDVYFDPRLDHIDSTVPLIDLRALFNNSNLFNFKKLAQLSLIQYRLTTHGDLVKQFYLDQSESAIYVRDLVGLSRAPQPIVLDVMVKKLNTNELRAKLHLYMRPIPTKRHVKLTVDRMRHVEADWIKVHRFGEVNSSANNVSVGFVCRNLAPKMCSGLFKFNKITDELLVDGKNLIESIVVDRKLIRLDVMFNRDRRLFVVELEIDLQLTVADEVRTVLDEATRRVYLINTTLSDYRACLTDVEKIDNGTALEVLRVKNMLTNSQVLALDYKISVDGGEACLQFDDVLSLELNQLYAFDVAVRDPEHALNYPMSNYLSPVTVYLIRFNPYYSETDSTYRSVDHYANLAQGEVAKFAFNLTQIQLDNQVDVHEFGAASELVQKIFLLNRIGSNRHDLNLARFFKLKHDSIQFDSHRVPVEYLGDVVEISVFKLIIDKLALKVTRIIEFKIKLETFDAEHKYPSINIPHYYREITLTKTDIVRKFTYTSLADVECKHDGYDVLVFDFNREYPSNNIFEYYLDYHDDADYPFELEKYTGRLYYLTAEDARDEYDDYGLKRFKLDLYFIDSARARLDFTLLVTLIDDDPLRLTMHNLVNTFYLAANVNDQKLTPIGRIDVPSALRNSIETNLSHVHRFVVNNPKMFQFQLVNSTDSGLFRLDAFTGQLFLNRSNRTEHTFYKLTVTVSGSVGYKSSCLFHVDVYVMLGNRFVDLSIVPVKFDQTELTTTVYVRSFEIGGYFQPIDQLRVEPTSPASRLRFKLLNDHQHRCEVNWYDGSELKCLVNRRKFVTTETITLFVLAYDLDDTSNYDSIKIDVLVNYEPRPEEDNSNSMLVNQSMGGRELGEIMLRINRPMRLGDVLTNVFDLLNQTQCSHEYRAYLVEYSNRTSSQNRSLISSYFELNAYTGDLTLKQDMLENKLTQNVQLVHGSRLDALLSSARLFRLDIEIGRAFLNQISLKETDEEHDVQGELPEERPIRLRLAYDRLTRNRSSQLILSELGSYFGRSFTYLIEAVYVNKSISDGFDIVLSNTIRLVDNYNSLVRVDNQRLVLTLNVTEFLRLNLFRFDFTLVKLRESNAHQPDARIRYQIELDFGHNVQYLLDYMGYRQLVVEKHIHSDTARIGQVVFDLNQTLFDGNYFGQHLTFRLKSTSQSSLPFSVDPSNGNLILTNDLLKSRRRVYEFGVEMSDLFTIRFKIRVLVQQPITTGEIQVSYSEIQRLKVSKYCRENHLIGSVNNLADGRADGEFFFLLKNYHNLIRLNRTSGELTCASQFSEQSTSDYVVKIEIDVFKRRYSAYVKTILLYLEIYNLDRNQFYLSSIYNERLIFEITMSDRDIVWNVPAMISQRYETCLIIAGNYGSRFYLNQRTFQLELIPELEPSRVDEYQLLIRCFSVNYEEIDIQLNVQIANGSAAVDQIDLDAPLPDTDLHEVNLNVENFRNDDPLIKLNVTWAEFEPSTDGLVGFFQSLLRLDKHTGEIRVNLADFNKYHEYCRLVERGRVKINYVLTVRVRLGSVNSSVLLRVNPNCLGTDVNLTFKRPVYMLTLRHTDRLNRPLGSVSVVDDVRLIYSVAYYFCTPNGLFELSDIDDPPLLRVDKTSGLIYLQRLVDLVEFQHREYKLCAALESKLFKSTVLVESQLLVKIDPPKDTLTLSTFDGQTQLSVDNGPITLTFPYEQLGHHRRFTAANQLNLFKLDPVKNGFFSLLTTSSHLIHVDSVTGWIRLDKSRITSHRTQPQTHSVRVSVASRNLPLTRLVYIDLQLNFVKTRPALDLFIPFYTQVGSKLIDVKRYLHSNEHRFLVMHGAELPCTDCVYFNPNDGFVYLLKPIQLTQLNRPFKFTLRYTSDECDFDILKINVQFYKHANNLSVTSKPKFDIYISAMSPIGSVVYDTFTPITRISSDYGSFFGVEHSKLLIGRNLTSLLDECPVEINVMTESESITLNVYLIERVSQNVQFARLNYYVEYGIKLDESSSTHELVRLELSEPKLVQFDSNIPRIGELKCLGDKYEYSIDAEQVYEFFTVIPDVDYFRVFVNNKRVVDYSCDFYKLTVELTPVIKTQVYVEIVNFSQLKFLSLFSDLDERHNRTLNATTSLTQQLDVYQLLGVKKQLIELKPDLMWSEHSPVQEFTFTPDDGFITFNMGYNLSKPVYRIRIDLIGYKQLNDQIVVKKFQLCLFVVYNSEFKYRPLFGRDSLDVKFDLAPGAVINPVDLRTYIYRDGQRGVRFSLANNDHQLVTLDQLTGEVSLNEALASKYVFFLNVSRPVQITACSETDDCDSITVYVNIISRPSTNVYDHLKRFYAAMSTRQSMKLRKFGDTINRYDLYKTGSELIDLNYSNGLLTGRLADDLELTLVYNNTMLIKFKIPGEPVRPWARANASSKFDDLSVDLNVRTWGRSTVGYYLTSLNRFDPRYGCELWNTVRDESSFALDSNCDLYVRDRADERLQLGVRIYDTRRVFKSTLIRVQVAVNRIGFNLSRLLFIEYEKSNGKSLEGLYGYFKRDRIISSPITLHQEFDNDVHLVALESSKFEMDKIFASGLESQLVKLESDLNVRVRSVYSSNMCFFHLKQQNHACHLNNFFRSEDSSSNFIPFYQRLLETNTTLVRIPDSKANMIRLGANDLARQKLNFKNRIKFNRLNYIRYDGFNLTYEGYMSLKVSFRYLDAVYSNTNMIFHSDLLVGEARGYFVNIEMVQSKLEIKHNLLSNKRRSVLSLDHELKQNRWYQVQLQIVQNELSVELKQWNMRTVQDLSQRKKVKLADDLGRAFSSGFQVDRMFIGGLNERLSTTNTFYSDELEVADFSLNNYELLDRQLMDYKSAVLVLNEPQDLNDKRDQYCAANVYSSNCDRALGSLSLGRSSSFRIDFNMKPHYWQFVQLEKTSQNGPGFNLTLVFHFDHQLNPTDNKEIILLRSENSLLLINPVKLRFELKTNNRLVAWIPILMPNRHNSSSSDQQLYKLTILAWNENKTKMMLNQQQRVFDASSMELFTSPYIRLVFSQIEPLIQVCLRSIYFNNDRISMFDGTSKYFISRTWMPGSTSQFVYGSCSSKNEPVYNDVNKNFNLVGEDLGDAADKAPSLIIITVLITSFVALVAILSILVNIYLRSKMSKTTSTSRRTMFKQAIPVVGKNQFEISMNTSSQQNSPVPSEICSLSTNNSFSQYAVKPAPLNNSAGRIKPIVHEKMIEKAKNECILNCLNLEDNTMEGNYFTCDTIKMSTFNLVGQPEFVFKRVNLNKNYHNVEQTMVRKADDKQMNDSSASVSFDANDLNKLKSMLNWTPTLTQFDELFDEFEKFIQHEHVCKNDFRPKRELEYLPVNTTINSVNQTNSTINLYENCEKHTFV